jgi:hypothetical protein
VLDFVFLMGIETKRDACQDSGIGRRFCDLREIPSFSAARFISESMIVEFSYILAVFAPSRSQPFHVILDDAQGIDPDVAHGNGPYKRDSIAKGLRKGSETKEVSTAVQVS